MKSIWLLNAEKAPISAQNFLDYANAGHYNGTIFHRVIPEFMAQAGGHTADLSEKVTRDSFQNEADNGLKNNRGTLAMARTMDPHSASAQFYLNVNDNNFLDHKGKNSPRDWGYAVFGEVVSGMDVVDSIVGVKTGTRNNGMQNVPEQAVVIESVSVINCPEQ